MLVRRQDALVLGTQRRQRLLALALGGGLRLLAVRGCLDAGLVALHKRQGKLLAQA
jgi:hypothetical protein